MPYKDAEARKAYEKNRPKRKRAYDPERCKTYYEANRERLMAAQKKNYDANRESILEQKKQYNLEHKPERAEYNKKYWQKNKDVLLEDNKEWRSNNAAHIQAYEKKRGPVRHLELKNKVFNHYGRKCVHCGNEDFNHLTLDHINNDGAENRKTLGTCGNNFYRWIVKNDYPEGLQVLCANCNFRKWVKVSEELREGKQSASLKSYRKTKKEVLVHYGAKCARCGEEDTAVLGLDHINGDGHKHRKSSKQGIYTWAKQNGYPDTLQVLCANCNQKKNILEDRKATLDAAQQDVSTPEASIEAAFSLAK